MAETELLDCLLILLILAVLAFYYFTFLKTAKNNAQGTNKEKMKIYFSAMSLVFIPGFLITTSTDILEWVKDAPSAAAMLLVLSISMVWSAVSLVLLFLGSHGRRIQDHEIVGDGSFSLMAETELLDCLLILLILAVLAFYYFTFLKTAKKNAPLLPSNFSTSCAYSSPQGTNKEKMKTYFSAMSLVFIPGFLITTSTDILEWVKDAPSAAAMLLVLSISMVWGAVSLVLLFLGSHGRRIQDHEIVGDGPACLNASPSIANFAGSGADTSADSVTLA